MAINNEYSIPGQHSSNCIFQPFKKLTSYIYLIRMASNQDRIDAILDQMWKENDPQALSEGLNILSKLTANIISNPFEQKYRGIKTTNNTIKNKIMNLKRINQLLLGLGFVRENEEMLTLRDERLGEFLEGEPAIEFRRRLAAARLNSQADYQKELQLIKIHKQNRALQQKRDEEARKLKEKCKYDQQERAHMKVDETKSNTLKFGSKATTYKDIGVDLCKTKGG